MRLAVVTPATAADVAAVTEVVAALESSPYGQTTFSEADLEAEWAELDVERDALVVRAGDEIAAGTICTGDTYGGARSSRAARGGGRASVLRYSAMYSGASGSGASGASGSGWTPRARPAPSACTSERAWRPRSGGSCTRRSSARASSTPGSRRARLPLFGARA